VAKAIAGKQVQDVEAEVAQAAGVEAHLSAHGAAGSSEGSDEHAAHGGGR
jgi:hypothetical protein